MRNPPDFDPLLFLTLARLLATTAEERHIRTAVGRAYYTAFLIARDKLGVVVQKDVHTEVIRALRGRNRAWADKLDSLRRLRLAADYELTASDPTRRDWARNWTDTNAIATQLVPVLQAIP
jgi:hypothetical protein